MKLLKSSLVLFLLTATFQVNAQKVSIGIGEITSSVRGSNPANFQTMLETALTKTNKFSVIERGRLDEILKEQGLGSSALVTDGAGFGGIQGVDYLMYGSITKLGQEDSGMAVGGFATSSSSAVMAIDLKVVDTTNGEIALADSVEAKISSGGGLAVEGFSIGESSGDPLADVQRLAAEMITAQVVTAIYPVKIIAIQGDGTIILNYGKGLLAEGDILNVFEVGEGFTDPDTGEVLGAEEILLGKIEVTNTQAKFSKSIPLDGAAEQFSKGNLCRKARGEAAKRPNKKKKLGLF